MNDENDYGAPAEGLGQNITFSQDLGPVREQRIARAAGLQIGVQGGNRVVQGQAPNIQGQILGKFATRLMDIAAEAEAEDFKKKQTEAFMDGMQSAATGQGVQAILKKQTSVDMMFGTGLDAVAGARQYTAQSAAADYVGRVTADKERLRTLGMGDASRHFTDAMATMTTGDKDTDQAAVGMIMNLMPKLMQQQAVDHQEFLQEKASLAFFNSAKQIGTAVQAVGAGSDPGAAAAATEALMQGLVPPPGMPDSTALKAYAQAFSYAAAEGNIRFLEAAKKFGMFDKLPPELQMRAQAGLDSAANRAEEKWRVSNAKDLYELEKASRGMTPGASVNALREMQEKLNQKFQRDTGATRPLFTSAEALQDHISLKSAMFQEDMRQAAENRRRYEAAAQAAAVEGAKAEAKIQEDSLAFTQMQQARTASVSGNFGPMKLMGDKFTSAQVEDRGREVLMQAVKDSDGTNGPGIPLGETLGTMRATDDRSLNGVRADMGNVLDRAISSGVPSQEFAAALAVVNRVQNTAPAFLADVVGPSNVKAWRELAAGSTDPASLAPRLAAMRAPKSNAPTFSAEVTKKVAKEIGADPETSSGLTRMDAIADAAQLAGIPTAQIAGNAALLEGMARRAGLEVAGKFAWRRHPDDQPFYQRAIDEGTHPADVPKAVEELLGAKIQKAGYYRMVQGRDPETALPCLFVTVIRDGTPLDYRITSEDVASQVRTSRQRAVGKMEQYQAEGGRMGEATRRIQHLVPGGPDSPVM